MQSLYEILLFVIRAFRFLVIAHFMMGWLIRFEVLNVRQPLVVQVYFGLKKVLAPIYEPLRRIVPTFGQFDVTPILVLILLTFLEIILRNNVAYFV
jgi:YggT family protein